MSTLELQENIDSLIKQLKGFYPGRFDEEYIEYLKSVSADDEKYYANLQEAGCQAHIMQSL